LADEKTEVQQGKGPSQGALISSRRPRSDNYRSPTWCHAFLLCPAVPQEENNKPKATQTKHSTDAQLRIEKCET
jgi:hypothetical protein